MSCGPPKEKVSSRRSEVIQGAGTDGYETSVEEGAVVVYLDSCA